MRSEYLYHPSFGLLKPDIVASPKEMSQTDSSVFPEVKVTISKDTYTSEYQPFQLYSNMDAILEWMKNSMITLPATQEKPLHQPEPYCSIDMPYMNTGEIMISLLDMLNQCGGIMHVQQYFDGKKINFKRTYAQFAQSTQNNWGVLRGNSWSEFSRVQNDRSQELWVHAQAWKKIQEIFDSRQQKEVLQENSYIPQLQEYAMTKETQLTRVLQFIATLNNLLAQQQMPTCYIYAKDDMLSSTYYLYEEQSLQGNDLSGEELVLAHLDEELYEKKRKMILKQIHDMIPLFLSESTQVDARENLEGRITELFKKKLSKILITKFLLPSQNSNYFVDYSFD